MPAGVEVPGTRPGLDDDERRALAPNILRRATMRLRQLDAATTIEDLRREYRLCACLTRSLEHVP
jgi:hypothetical protein